MYIPPELTNIIWDIYLRRSSDDSDHQVASLSSQKTVLTTLQKTNKLKIARIVEESMSAKQPGRPIFNEEIQRIQEGVIHGLIVWDLSRCSRNPVDSGALGWLLQQGKLQAILTPHKIYLPEDNVLLLNVEFGMANQYLRDLSKNVKRGLQNKLANGWRPGVAPEGYMNNLADDKGNRTIIPDPERFALVRKMWELLLIGTYTVPQILKIATTEWGYRTRKHRSSGGEPLSRSGMYGIFTNPFYYGDYQYGGAWYTGKHQPMITQEEFDKAQAILGRKGKQRPKTREFAFTGMIRCGECSAMITAEEKINRHGKRYIYYHCTKRINPNCTQKAVELKNLEKQIDEILSQIEIPETFKDWAIQYLNELHDKETNDQATIATGVERAYKDCLARINNLIKLKISPINSDGYILSDEEFQKQLTPLQAQKKQLKQQIDGLDKRADMWLELSQKTFQFACYARYHFQNGTLQEKRVILATIGSNFLLKDKKLSLTVPKPFVSIEKAKHAVDEILARLEFVEKPDTANQTAHLYAQNAPLRKLVDDVQTFYAQLPAIQQYYIPNFA